MATTEMNCLASGGGNQPFKVLKIFNTYNTSSSLSIPNDTDFIVAVSCSVSENMSPLDVSSYDVTAVVDTVGVTSSTTQAVKNGSASSITVALSWDTKTSATLTRSSTSACTLVLACKYV